MFLARFCCGSAVDAAAAFLFYDAVSLFVLVQPQVAVLRLVETATAGRPWGGATGVQAWSRVGGRGGSSDTLLDVAGREAALATSKSSCEVGPLSADSVPLSRREGVARREGWSLMGGARLAGDISSWVAAGDDCRPW